MIELFEKLNEKASHVASIMLAELIADADLLTVALCAGNFQEIVRTLMHAYVGECRHLAAHKAIDIGFNAEMRGKLAKEGFFSKGLIGLMELAKHDSDTGSRLMPIFAQMVSDCEKYGISQKLKRRTVCYMEHIRRRDGFAITYIGDDGQVIVRPAEGLFNDK